MRTAFLGFALGLGLVVLSPAATHADDPEVEQLEAQLVQSRTRLNELYQSSAAASEQLNGARYRLAETRKQLDRERRRARDTTRELAESSAVVAALTVEQLQNGAGAAKIEVLVGSATPTQLLERVAAYASTAEAMTAKLDELAANQTVHRVSVERWLRLSNECRRRSPGRPRQSAQSQRRSRRRSRRHPVLNGSANKCCASLPRSGTRASQSSSNDKPRSIPRLTATTLSSRSHRRQSRRRRRLPPTRTFRHRHHRRRSRRSPLHRRLVQRQRSLPLPCSNWVSHTAGVAQVRAVGLLGADHAGMAGLRCRASALCRSPVRSKSLGSDECDRAGRPALLGIQTSIGKPRRHLPRQQVIYPRTAAWTQRRGPHLRLLGQTEVCRPAGKLTDQRRLFSQTLACRTRTKWPRGRRHTRARR